MAEDTHAISRKAIELQAAVCYQNVDRTLATWTRTALSLIVFGAVVDRYGLLIGHPFIKQIGTPLVPNPMSTVAGVVLVALGVFIVVAAAVRHQAYTRLWKRTYAGAPPHGPYLAFAFSASTAVFGILLLAVLFGFRQ
jgi:uncharacterized membrane protein YidH (DUF202 family)